MSLTDRIAPASLYIVMPVEVLKRKDLTDRQKIVLAWFLGHRADADGCFRLTQTRLAEEVGSSLRSLRDTLHRLEELGLLTIGEETHAEGRYNTYRLHLEGRPAAPHKKVVDKMGGEAESERVRQTLPDHPRALREVHSLKVLESYQVDTSSPNREGEAPDPFGDQPTDDDAPLGADRSTASPATKRRTTHAHHQGTRLPSDWKPSPELAAWAERERPDLDLAKVVDAFVDYWIGVPGSRGLNRSWDGAFRNWVRREQKAAFQRKGNSGPAGGARIVDGIMRRRSGGDIL